MKFLWITALPTVTAFQQMNALNFLYDKAHVQSTQTTRFLQRQQQVVRKLDVCDFFTSLELNCSIDEFCDLLNEGDEISTYECGGDLTGSGEFYYKILDPIICYENFGEVNGTVVNATDIPPPEEIAYCSKTTGYFNFTGNVLTVTDLTEEITAPDELKGVLRMVLPMSVCTMDESDFFANQPYCIGECPTSLEINGVQCDAPCLECDDGSQLPNCGNIDEKLAGDCDAPEWTDDDFTQEFLAFFNKTNAAPPPTSSSARHSLRSLLGVLSALLSVSVLF